jgi:enoyl-CoA hydratase/carnithine racemase
MIYTCARPGSRAVGAALRARPIFIMAAFVFVEAVVRPGGVLVATLRRPDVLNAVNLRLAEEVLALADALATPHGPSEPGRDTRGADRPLAGSADVAAAAAGGAVRAVVVTGAGRAFSAGRDLTESRTHTPRDADRFQDLVRATTDRWAAVPVPTIAAIHGACMGWVGAAAHGEGGAPP